MVAVTRSVPRPRWRLALATVSLLGCAPEPALHPLHAISVQPDTAVPSSVNGVPHRMVVAAGAFWFRTFDAHGIRGELTSVALSNGATQRHLASLDVRAIHGADSGELWVIARDEQTDDLRILALRKGGWHVLEQWSHPVDAPDPIALTEVFGAPMVITRRSLVRRERQGIRLIPLSIPLEGFGEVYVAASVRGTIYVGSRGGGLASGRLYAIDAVSGQVEQPGCIQNEPVDPSSPAIGGCLVLGIVPEPASNECVLMASESAVVRQCGTGREVLDGPWNVDFVRSTQRLFAALDPAPTPLPEQPAEALRAMRVRCARGDGATCEQLSPTLLQGLAGDADTVWIILRGVALRWSGPAAVELHFHTFPNDPRVHHYIERGLVVYGQGADSSAAMRPGVPVEASAPAAAGTAPAVGGCYRRIGGSEEICLADGRLEVRVEGRVLVWPTSAWATDSSGGLAIQFGEQRLLVRDWGPMATIVLQGTKDLHFGDFFLRTPP